MEIKTVCVAGGGRMGRQIAMCAAISGYAACVYEIVPAVRESVLAWADEYLEGRIAKGRLSAEQVEAVKGRFRVENDLKAAVEDADMIIEAIIEVEDAKKALFKEISGFAKEDAIVATNSSFMVSSKFADCLKNPARLCNMHFYNPALVMKLVEVVQGPHTSAEAAEAAYNFCISIGKKPIWMKKEIEGFAGTYMIEGLHDRARYLVENGYLTPQEADIAMEEGFRHPLGPFRMLDINGVNLTFDIMKRRYEETGVKDHMYDVFEQMVREGRTGKNAGHGFYDYE